MIKFLDLKFRPGEKRSRKGVPRPVNFPVFHVLTPSEIARGYLYITMSKKVLASIDTDDLTVVIAGQRIVNRRVRLGRVTIPRELLQKYFKAGTAVGIYKLSMTEIEIRAIESSTPNY